MYTTQVKRATYLCNFTELKIMDGDQTIFQNKPHIS